MSWYIVMGRLSGDDEDSYEILQEPTIDAAVAAFERRRRAHADDDPEEPRALSLTYVFSCGRSQPVCDLNNT